MAAEVFAGNTGDPSTVAAQVRAHIFIASLAYSVQWRMRPALGPRLFDDEWHGAPRASAVAPAAGSAKAQAKARRKRTREGWPGAGFQDWLKDLAAIVKNRIQPKLKSLPPSRSSLAQLLRSRRLSRCSPFAGRQ